MPIFSNKHYWALMNKLVNIEAAVVRTPEQMDPHNHIVFYSNNPHNTHSGLVTFVVGSRELSRLLESPEWKTFVRFLHREFGLLGENEHSHSLLQRILSESETEKNTYSLTTEDFECQDVPE